jgi:2'-5' RNA ligase
MGYSFSGGGLERSPQRSYAVVIYLPSELEQIIAPLRERFDPDYSSITAHVTLVFPFETDRPLIQLTDLIASATGVMEPLTIGLDSIGDFYPNSPIIYWKVRECEKLNLLYRRLYADLELPLPHRQFLPHVTVAREISQHRVMLVKDEIAPYLPEESFEAGAVDLVSPVAGDQWVSVRSFPLGAV